ncbi:MAG: glycosyltransferase [Candidatus Woesearchaeota archaeon]
MKIAIFTDTFYPEINGVVTFVLNLAEHLKGCNFYVFAPEYPDEMYGKKVKNFDFGSNVKVFRYKSIKLISNPSTRIVVASYEELEKNFEEIMPDIIHVQSFGIIGMYGLKVSKKYKIPAMATYHTYFPDFITYISPVRLLKLDYIFGTLIFKNIKLSFIDLYEKNKNNFFGKILDYFYLISELIYSQFKLVSHLTSKTWEAFLKSFTWYVTKSFYNEFDIITAPSQYMVKVLQDHGVYKPCIFISNGIELDKFTFTQRTIKNQEEIRLLHVGRLGFEKNIDILVKMMKFLNLQKKYRFHLDIVGDGPAKASLEKLAQEMKIKNITFHGMKLREELPEYYKKAHIFVTASTIETQGIVVLEAMATGLPVVGANKLALQDLIIDHYNGLKAKPFDPRDFAMKVISLVEKEDIEELSKNARKTVMEHDINTVMERFKQLYHDVYRIHQLYQKYIV